MIGQRQPCLNVFSIKKLRTKIYQSLKNFQPTQLTQLYTWESRIQLVCNSARFSHILTSGMQVNQLLLIYGIHIKFV